MIRSSDSKGYDLQKVYIGRYTALTNFLMRNGMTKGLNFDIQTSQEHIHFNDELDQGVSGPDSFIDNKGNILFIENGKLMVVKGKVPSELVVLTDTQKKLEIKDKDKPKSKDK